MVLNKAIPPLVTSANSTKSTKTPSLGTQRKSSSKLSPHFNVITDNGALAIEKVILATIYCPNGNPSLRLFRIINTLSKQVLFLGDFNSKHKKFGCVKPNKSGQTLVNIAKDLKLFYVNQLGPNRHTRDDPVHGTSDILDMAFISPGLSSGTFLSALLMIIWAVITSPFKFHLTSHSNGTHHLPNHVTDLTKTNGDLLHSTLKDSLTNIDTNITTQDELEELTVTLYDKLMKTVDTSTPEVYSRNDPKSPISQAILDLIKEKRRLRRLYNNTQDPNTKSTINKLQK